MITGLKHGFDSIPSDWELVPYWSITQRSRAVAESSEPLLSVYLDQGVIPHDEDGRQVHAPSVDRSAYQLVAPGDFVLNNQQAFRGSVAVSQLRGLVSPAYLVFKLEERLRPAYAKWLLPSQPMVDQYGQVSRGVGSIQRQINPGELRDVKVALPPLAEQDRLACLLDQEVGRVDRLVEITKRWIEAERDRETSLLCAHLIPHFTPWDPAHVPLKRLASVVRRPTTESDDVVTAFRDGVVTRRAERRTDGFTFSEDEETYIGVEPGDLVFHGLDGFAGAVGISDSRGKVSPVNHTLQVHADRVDASYLALVLRALGRIGYLAVQASNVRQRAVDFRNFDKLGAVRVPLLPLRGQRLAVSDFQQALSLSRSRIEAGRRRVDLLVERRQALITAAVTGVFTGA